MVGTSILGSRHGHWLLVFVGALPILHRVSSCQVEMYPIFGSISWSSWPWPGNCGRSCDFTENLRAWAGGFYVTPVILPLTLDFKPNEFKWVWWSSFRWPAEFGTAIDSKSGWPKVYLVFFSSEYVQWMNSYWLCFIWCLVELLISFFGGDFFPRNSGSRS